MGSGVGEWDMENGDLKCSSIYNNNMEEKQLDDQQQRVQNHHVHCLQSASSSLVRIRRPVPVPEAEAVLVASRVRVLMREFVANVQEVVLGTKLSVLFLAIPLAIVAQCYQFARAWIFGLSLLGLAPLAERLSFLTEQIAHFTGPTVGGLLNATCGNAPELIIGIFALHKRKLHVLKYSLLGSILSNLLLVLGSSLLCGGLANLRKEQRFDRKQADANLLLLLLGLLCHVLPLMFRYAAAKPAVANYQSILELSRASSIVMLVAYVAFLIFQLKTHTQLFESQEMEQEEGECELPEEKPVIGICSGLIWLIGMTVIIAILSEYIVGTIEAASDSWGISVSFMSMILLPIVGNAAEHAGSVIFAFKNKLDISLGVALGSAAQISLFVVPLCVIIAWIMGISMDLDFSLLETGCLAFSIILTAFTLQDGTSHYMKGAILCLSYIVIGACFFFHRFPLAGHTNGNYNFGTNTSTGNLAA